MDALLADLGTALGNAFEGEEYQTQRQTLEVGLKDRQETAIGKVGEAAAEAAKEMISGSPSRAESARQQARQALEQAKQAADQAAADAAESPAGQRDAAAQQQVTEKVGEAQQLAGGEPAVG